MIQEKETVSILDTLIEDCNFTLRLQNVLVANNICCVKQVVMLSEEQIMGFNYLGRGSFNELRDFLNNNRLKLVGDIDKEPEQEVEQEVEKVVKRETKVKARFDTHISYCGLNTKGFNTLISHGIKTVGNLTTHSENSLLRLSGLGVTTLKQIKKFLRINGLSLTDNLTKSLQEEVVKGMQLNLSLTDKNSKKVIELWIELNEPLLSKHDNQLIKAKCFLANIKRLETERELNKAKD